MRKAAAILAVVMVWLCGCTRNDGDIGPLFGTWQLTEREVTGEEVSAPLPPVKELFWSFQSSVIEMKHVYGTSRYESIYGNWDLQGKTLRLIFRIRPSRCSRNFCCRAGVRWRLRSLTGRIFMWNTAWRAGER